MLLTTVGQGASFPTAAHLASCADLADLADHTVPGNLRPRRTRPTRRKPHLKRPILLFAMLRDGTFCEPRTPAVAPQRMNGTTTHKSGSAESTNDMEAPPVSQLTSPPC
ncbi:hypothetical protein OG786_27940 [Streptomyces sp. NBC_00101]